ncbi:hypothetical protein [Catellatospora tritici]|uniref:hypothetical protein n=1 Tax=Catellatospora tritici TaxID=2851566 RepID=UPI001C2DB1F8|nr:hypothetical protein [Catellatospora tritici]MBV1856754.1 hypothetical protein [Catellatospora tritici]
MLGEILASGAVDEDDMPLLASALELHVRATEGLQPEVWRDADDDLAGMVSDVQGAWERLRRTWVVTRDVLRRVSEARAAVGARRSEMSRAEWMAQVVEADQAQGGPAARAELAARLRALVDALSRLPFVRRCESCGHAVPN